MQVSLYKKPLAIAIAALVSSLIILSSSSLLLSFFASFVLVCVLPGLALIHLLRGKLGSPDVTEKTIISVGTGYVLLITAALVLVYLPIPFSRGNILLTYNLLILILLGLSLWSRGDSEGSAAIPKSALYAFLLTAAIASALRFPSLGYSEFMGDEAKVLLWATEVIEGHGDVILLYRKGPAEILISAVLYALAGRTNELSARLPFAIANLVAVLTIFQLGRSMFGLRVGLAAGLLASIEGFFVGLARVVQYQSLVILLGCLGVWFFYRLYRGSVKGSPLLGTITLAAGFLCHWDMIFIVPIVIYLSFEALRRHGKAIWSNLNWLVAAALLATALLASFFLPYFLSAHFGETLQYLTKRVRASRFPYFHLRTFFDYGTVYNSVYYSLLMSLVVFLEAAYITRLSLRRKGSSAPTRAAMLITVPVALFIWLGADHPERVASLACVSLALIFVLLSDQRVEAKAIVLWFFIPLISYTFVVRLPLLHIYNLSSAVSLLGGSALARSLSLLRSLGQRRIAMTGFALWYVISANYTRMAFVQTSPEYQRTYPDYRHPVYWTPYGDTSPRVNTFGFPHAAGWKVVGSLYERRVIEGDYDSNEKETVTQWYTRGRVRCKDEPRYYFLAENVEDEQPVPLDTIAEQYRLVAAISMGSRPKLRIYEKAPTIQEEIDHYQLADWIPVFDNEISGSYFFTGVPRTDPVALILHPVDVRFGNTLRVLGYSLQRSEFQPGDYVTLVVYWQMLDPLASGHRVFIHLGRDEDRWAQRDVHPGCGLLSDNDWIPGKVVADRYSFGIAPSTPPGWYPLRVGMYRLEATSERRSKVPIFDQYDNRFPQDDVFLTKVQVGEPGIDRDIRYPLAFKLGDSVTLLGYDLAETEVASGSMLRYTLFWQAHGEIPTSYTVFSHLVDENDRIQGQWDSVPQGGHNPTNEWVSGEIIVDRYEMPVSADSAPGQHMLRVGMYDIITGQRLPVRDAAGSLLNDAYIPLRSIDVRSG